MQRGKSVQKIARLLQDRQDLEQTGAQDDVQWNEPGSREQGYFRDEGKPGVGPFIDPETDKLNLDADYSAMCLSEQYPSVFTQPRPEWSIENMKEFFKVDNSRPRGPTLTYIEFSESDIEFACSELSSTSAPGPDGVPAAFLKICRKELKSPLYALWRVSLDKGIIPLDLVLVLVSPIHKGGSRADPGQ
jgi:hypothetical protein